MRNQQLQPDQNTQMQEMISQNQLNSYQNGMTAFDSAPVLNNIMEALK